MAESQELPNNPYATMSTPPVVVATQVPAGDQEGDQTGGLIPYKNPQALVAYYLGLFSLLPVIGFFLAIPALVLGIRGLRARKRNPIVKGSIHAWIGIVMGILMTLFQGALLLALIVGIVAGAQHTSRL